MAASSSTGWSAYRSCSVVRGGDRCRGSSSSARPTATGGATSATVVAEAAPVAFAQLLIQVVKIWPQALVVREPAVVSAAHLDDHQRRSTGCARLTTVLASRVGEVHIVAAREVRHLRGRGRVVALAAAVLAADVVPQIDLEGLHVRRRRRRSRVGIDAAGRSAEPGVAVVAAPPPPQAARPKEAARVSRPMYACRFHDQFPMQYAAASANTCRNE